jgi:rubrerythrin
MEATLDGILAMAIASEEAAIELYRGLAQMVDDDSTREALEYLAEEEVQHRSLLESYKRGEIKEGALAPQSVINPRIVEYLGAPTFDSQWSPQDAFLVAAKQEHAAYEFYTMLAEQHPEGEARELLNSLARQELAHKERVEYIYANTAFPQTDGG